MIVRKHDELTRAVLGVDPYQDACRRLGLPTTRAGYGLLHCVDENGVHVTRATRDVAYHRLLVEGMATAETGFELELPGGTYPLLRFGWPDEWHEHADDARYWWYDYDEPADAV